MSKSLLMYNKYQDMLNRDSAALPIKKEQKLEEEGEGDLISYIY
jgi:hypothetical protein